MVIYQKYWSFFNKFTDLELWFTMGKFLLLRLKLGYYSKHQRTLIYFGKKLW